MGWLDYAVMVVFLAGMIVIGVVCSRKERDTADYLLGGRSIPYWALAISMFATLFSALSFLGRPSETYQYGLRMFLSVFLAPPLIWLSLHLFLRFYYRLGAFTPYSYLERRFDRSVRLWASALFMLQRIIYLGVVLYASSIAFQSVCGWPPWVTILILGVLGAFYTVMGGVKAVVWTDVVQFAVFFGGLVALLVLLRRDVDGGVLGGVAYAFEHGRGFRLDPSFWTFSPHERITFWLLLFTTTVSYFFTYSADQLNVQRILATKNYREARRAAYLSWLVGLPVMVLLCLIGLLLFTFYSISPLAEGLRDITPDRAFPVYIATFLPSPLTGVLMTALMAAILSTLDSGINSLSAIFVKDIYKPFLRPAADEAAELKVAYYASLAAGALLIGMSLFITSLSKEGATTIMEISGVWSAAVMMLTAVFLLGVTTRSVGPRLIKFLLAVAPVLAVVSIKFLYYDVAPEERISFNLVGNAGGIFMLLAGYGYAALARKPTEERLAGLTLFDSREPPPDSLSTDSL